MSCAALLPSYSLINAAAASICDQSGSCAFILFPACGFAPVMRSSFTPSPAAVSTTAFSSSVLPRCIYQRARTLLNRMFRNSCSVVRAATSATPSISTTKVSASAATVAASQVSCACPAITISVATPCFLLSCSKMGKSLYPATSPVSRTRRTLFFPHSRISASAFPTGRIFCPSASSMSRRRGRSYASK